MNVTKIAFDPKRREVSSQYGKAIGKILLDNREIVKATLFKALQEGDVIRTAKMSGYTDFFKDMTTSGKLRADILEQLINQFEKLIEDGFGFNAALYQLMEEGWVEKIGNFDLPGKNNG